jgi:hypothetical protein
VAAAPPLAVVELPAVVATEPAEPDVGAGMLVPVAGPLSALPLATSRTMRAGPFGRFPGAGACTLAWRAGPEEGAGADAVARVGAGAKPVGGRNVSVNRRTRSARGESGPGSAAAARDRPAATAVGVAPCGAAADEVGKAPPSSRRSTPPGVGCDADRRSMVAFEAVAVAVSPVKVCTEPSETAPATGACAPSDWAAGAEAGRGATLRRSAASAWGARLGVGTPCPEAGCAEPPETEPPETGPSPGARTLPERDAGPEVDGEADEEVVPKGARPAGAAGAGARRGAGTPPRAGPGLRRSSVTDSCRPAQARRSRPARPWVRLGGRLLRSVDPRAVRGTAPDSCRCASPSPGACPGPAPDRADRPWSAARSSGASERPPVACETALRRIGVVSLCVGDPNDPISATSFSRRTGTACDFIVDAKRPGTCVFSLGGCPITRCRPRAGSSAGPGDRSASPAEGCGSASVGAHQRGGRVTASNDRARIPSGAATWRRTSSGRAIPAANRRADVATFPIAAMPAPGRRALAARDICVGSVNLNVAARPNLTRERSLSAATAISASRYGNPRVRPRVPRTRHRCWSR